jgi:DNA polymerase-4
MTEQFRPHLPRCIAHLDMDAFYASVELLRQPELRGRPVVVGGRGRPSPTSRGVVTTASYEARRFGVRSGMPLRTALARCPDAVFLPTDFDEYRRMSRLFKQAIAEIAPTIEDRGIDEVYIDLTEVPGVEVEEGAAVAREIKHNVFVATGLSCSVGIAPNKLLAKLASELDKPDGLTVLSLDDLPTRIWPLAASCINGIGPKAAARLGALGIHTIGDLARTPATHLVARFGEHTGQWLARVAQAQDERPVVTHSEPKSRSRETTFERDLDPVAERDVIEEVVARLSNQVAADLERRGYLGRTIGIKLRFDDFATVTRDVSLPQPTAQASLIARTARGLLNKVPLLRPIRLLGVRVGNLVITTDGDDLAPLALR